MVSASFQDRIVLLACGLFFIVNASSAQDVLADEVGVPDTNCTISTERTQCLSEQTALRCHQLKCTCINGMKHPAYGANINIITEWEAEQGRCVAQEGSLCDLEGRVLLCAGKLECEKADGDYGLLPQTMGVGKCGASGISASLGLLGVLLLAITKYFN